MRVVWSRAYVSGKAVTCPSILCISASCRGVSTALKPCMACADVYRCSGAASSTLPDSDDSTDVYQPSCVVNGVGIMAETEPRVLSSAVLTRVFSHLLNRDPHFDFDVVLVPVPPVVQDNLAGWVDDHVDALVAEFAPEDDTVVIAAGGVGVDGDDEEDDSFDASSMDGGDVEGASS